MPPGVNNLEVEVKVLDKTYMIAHTCITTIWIVFTFGTWYACNMSLDRQCLSVGTRHLGRAKSQLLKLSVGQMCVQDKVLC